MKKKVLQLNTKKDSNCQSLIDTWSPAHGQLLREEQCRQHRLPDFGQGLRHQIVIHSWEIKMDSGWLFVWHLKCERQMSHSCVPEPTGCSDEKKQRCGTQGWTRGQDDGFSLQTGQRENEVKMNFSLFPLPILNTSCSKSHYFWYLYSKIALLSSISGRQGAFCSGYITYWQVYINTSTNKSIYFYENHHFRGLVAHFLSTSFNFSSVIICM